MMSAYCFVWRLGWRHGQCHEWLVGQQHTDSFFVVLTGCTNSSCDLLTNLTYWRNTRSKGTGSLDLALCLTIEFEARRFKKWASKPLLHFLHVHVYGSLSFTSTCKSIVAVNIYVHLHIEQLANGCRVQYQDTFQNDNMCAMNVLKPNPCDKGDLVCVVLVPLKQFRIADNIPFVRSVIPNRNLYRFSCEQILESSF
jgi:hypothetical protein